MADLFCGAGGLTLGVLEAGRALGLKVDPVFAADTAPHVRDAYQDNFSPREFETRSIESVLNGEKCAPATDAEKELRNRVGPIDLVVGGPPCQGHSNLNNFTRRNDPKNSLYGRMARFAEIFDPQNVIIENVHGAIYDRSKIVWETCELLRKLGYEVDVQTLRGERIGVPQTRHRVFLVASKNCTPRILDWEKAHSVGNSGYRSFDWACSGLVRNGDGPLDRETISTAETARRIDLLHDEGLYELPDSERPSCHRDKEHRYVSVYGRVKPELPAPTITTGFTCMGQGRFVHPHHRRTLTPREGARLQFLPNWFSFGTNDSILRKELVSLIGNAVPPKMTYVLALQLLR
jgi:DNA (cytosine-5)-methyltransferase 1